MCRCLVVTLAIVAVLFAMIYQSTQLPRELADQAVECWRTELEAIPNSGDAQYDTLHLDAQIRSRNATTPEQMEEFIKELKLWVYRYTWRYRNSHGKWKWEKKSSSGIWWLTGENGEDVDNPSQRPIRLDVDNTYTSGLIVYALNKTGIPRQILPYTIFLNVDPYAGCYVTELKKEGACDSSLRCEDPEVARAGWIAAHAPECPVLWKFSQMKEKEIPEGADMCYDRYAAVLKEKESVGST